VSLIILVMLATVVGVGVAVYFVAARFNLLSRGGLSKSDRSDAWAKEIFGSDTDEISKMLQGAISGGDTGPDSLTACLERCVKGNVVLRSINPLGPSRVEIVLVDLNGGSDVKLSGSSVDKFSVQSLAVLHAATKDIHGRGFTTKIKSYSKVGNRYTLKWTIKDPSGFQIGVRTKLMDLTGLILGSR